MSKIYEIDPDADTLVIVRPLAAPFAPWPPPEQAESSSDGATATGDCGEVRIKASSKHLSLASPYFRDRFAQTSSSGAWADAALAVQADGRVHVVLEGVDGAATTAVLNIVHGRGGGARVPRAVDLEALARIAVVVDRFRLHEAVDVYAERWVAALQRRGLPTHSGRDLVLWIYVAYVFGRDDVFRAATRVAATQGAGPLPPGLPGLPLRSRIAHDVEALRLQAIAAALDLLHGAVDALLLADDDERGDADAALLGILLKTLRRSGLAWPRPQQPYTGVSVASISRAAHAVQTQVWRLDGSNRRLLLTPKLDSLRAGIAGLDLKSNYGYPLY